jgi:hypothetical protein
MLDLFMEFHSNSLDIKRLNYGIVTLIPKIKDASRIQQFRPICLLNCIYKWFTKVLILRLEHVTKRIIREAQTTFIGGRSIMNNVLAMHEILHETKRKGEVGVVLKLDFEKAYDKVNWSFLRQCLVLRGFSETWCGWVQKVVQDGTIAIKLNGFVAPYF